MIKFIILLIVLFSTSLQAQVAGNRNIKFTYDAAGNRTDRREIILTPSPGAQATAIQKDLVGAAKISMSPNPTAGLINVQVDNYDNNLGAVNVLVYDFSGRLIINKPNIGNQIQIDLSEYPAATYSLRLQQGTKESVWKIVKL